MIDIKKILQNLNIETLNPMQEATWEGDMDSKDLILR